jgi:DNA mismatch repair protein MutL
VQTLERIRVLDAETIAQIAAGEVIERPVSVVKELVENSLDAGASWVAVELRDGGRTEILVADDGRGILADDLPIALHRHGTSKLSTAADLFAVRTLGFRGEGLASIAAAAGTLELTSRAAGQNFGARIATRNGSPGQISKVAASPGTRVSVRELFAATPVRREFLSSDKSEFARVSAFLSRLALGWPRVAFSLRHEDRDIWSLPAVDAPLERLEMVFGRGSRGSLTPVSTSPNIMIGIGGFTSRIGAGRPNRQSQVIFVNGRLVRSPALSAAWAAAYANRLESGRHPFGVLLLSVPPGDVDVNVHPTKIEVRFVSAATIFDVVRSAVSDAISTGGDAAASTFGSGPALAGLATAAGAPIQSLPAMSLLAGAEEMAGVSARADARALGQIDQTFVVIRDGQELIVLDQHAAHERVAFEALQSEEASKTHSAPLLLPKIVELSAAQIATLESYREELAAMGVIVEPFGDDAYRISALPLGYGERRFDLAGILEDLETDAERNGEGRTGEKRRASILASVACHSVVRAHEPLSPQEQLTLYERLRACREPQTCPHGRPTMLRLDPAALAKAFHRT